MVFPKQKNKARNSLNEEKTLHLVLDLDHTLLHSVLVSELSRNEKYLIREVDSRTDLWRFKQGQPTDYLIKLRPFLHEFLREANKLFLMHVYTMGIPDYAQTVLNLIDPEKVYFGDRVVTSKESPFKKTLDLVEASDQCKVVIVDDTSYVWPHHKANLLQITPYFYFREKNKSSKSSYAEEKGDESVSDGSLVNVLKFLQNVHRRFEEDDSKDLDLRVLLSDPSLSL